MECGVRSSAVASVSKARADYGGPCDSCPRVASAEHADRAETANRRDGLLVVQTPRSEASCECET